MNEILFNLQLKIPKHKYAKKGLLFLKIKKIKNVFPPRNNAGSKQNFPQNNRDQIDTF